MVREDANHSAAAAWLAQNHEPLLTTDAVVSETLTLLRARAQKQVATAFGAAMFGGQLATLHYLTPEQIRLAWDVFRAFDDKEWSFVDCTSKVAIESLGISTAFTFDHHFRQFGSVIVVP